MTRKFYPGACCYADALTRAAREQSSWAAAERAALGRLVGAGAAPLISMRRRWFFADDRYTFFVERVAGCGYAVGLVP
jgi:hypothetical protein